MKTSVFITDAFDAAHRLPGVPVGHKCRRPHGHTYRIRLDVKGKVGVDTGWVLDYAEIKSAWSPLKDAIDHRDLNEIQGLSNPTAELIAAWIFRRLKKRLAGLWRVELWETVSSGVVVEE